jgi:hypothetical protein
MRWMIVLAFVWGIFLSLPALATTVDSIQGKVSLNRGHGFQLVTRTTDADAGDLVMAGPDSKGRIVYSDGCVVGVYPGRVVTVEDRDPKALPGPCKQAGGFGPTDWPLALLALPAVPFLFINHENEHEHPASP